MFLQMIMYRLEHLFYYAMHYRIPNSWKSCSFLNETLEYLYLRKNNVIVNEFDRKNYNTNDNDNDSNIRKLKDILRDKKASNAATARIMVTDNNKLNDSTNIPKNTEQQQKKANYDDIRQYQCFSPTFKQENWFLGWNKRL